MNNMRLTKLSFVDNLFEVTAKPTPTPSREPIYAKLNMMLPPYVGYPEQ
jgi:hypothetical protein